MYRLYELLTDKAVSYRYAYYVVVCALVVVRVLLWLGGGDKEEA